MLVTTYTPSLCSDAGTSVSKRHRIPLAHTLILLSLSLGLTWHRSSWCYALLTNNQFAEIDASNHIDGKKSTKYRLNAEEILNHRVLDGVCSSFSACLLCSSHSLHGSICFVFFHIHLKSCGCMFHVFAGLAFSQVPGGIAIQILKASPIPQLKLHVYCYDIATQGLLPWYIIGSWSTNLF